MIKVLAVRSIKIQYSQTVLGVLWAAIQPLLALFIYTFFFYKILGIDSEGAPYPIFVMTGVLGWFNFSKVVNEAGMSLQSNQELISKVAFPKLILPLSKMISALMEVFISIILLIGLLVFFKIQVSVNLIFFPLFLLLNQVAALSVALWLNALTLRFRDIQHFIPFLISFGIWITPVFYPTTILPEKFEKFMYFNPIAGVIAGYRWSILGINQLSVHYMYGLIPVLILFVSGLIYFIKVEGKIADLV